MSQFGVIMALIFSLLIAIFALANNQPIIINYLYSQAEISAVYVILGAAFLGAFVIFLLSVFKQIKTVFRFRGLQSELNEARSQISDLEDERDTLLMQLGQLQESNVTPMPEPPPVGEPYVTGYYMDKQGTETKENVDIPSAPKVEEDFPGQEQEKADQKDEREI